ncbi:hypothetical protein [Francisella hispaniensis]|uniref:Uncharacterized protein n=1 Tax=Francisella hispaniensis TaxID=622488 RepID=F4BKB0_9GAMM|nr:hypothetical protein [Francisella hispaniensis]AEB28604.1 hypothetical protein FN3523_0747 [Francisella hispaniensis]
MKKTKLKSTQANLPKVGKYVGILLVINVFSAGYSAENDNSSSWDDFQEKVSDTSDAVATKTKKVYYKTKDALSDTGDVIAAKTKKAYYKAKDAITPEPSEDNPNVND